MSTTRALAIFSAAFGLALVVPAQALACGGSEHSEKTSFEQADKNGDGFLTREEVGTEVWDRIKVADTNHDNKVSKAELSQAYKEGKIGHKDKRREA